MRVAVVDVGTNSVRVLIADVEGRVIADVQRDLIITRLGEGVDRARALGAGPLARTVDAIAGYVRSARDADAKPIRVIATSAVRDAANADDFVDAVRAACGISPEILSGDDEARLGFAGATLDIGAPAPYLVVDIGGGSTELVRGSKLVERAISLDVGAVRMTERHIADDPPSAAMIADLRRDVDSHLDRAVERIGAERPATMIGLAGTITTLAAIARGLRRYERASIHHAGVSREEIGSIRARLCSMTSEQRRALPVMPRGREDVIVAGAVILEQALDRFTCSEVIVSESDILDGAALEMVP